MAGEFSTFTHSARRPEQYPQYQHDELAMSFAPVMQALREALSMLIDSKATPIPIVEKAYGVHVAMLADRTLLENASFKGDKGLGLYSAERRFGPYRNNA
ncbi:type VI secretion system baseplate subunit TssK [Pseudomonas protegens]|uniref:type VI secretion system baseplate subunit TssK n=1 Tax=Pseudomonas protegens TaxID=380021 RepID=UPI003D127C96